MRFSTLFSHQKRVNPKTILISVVHWQASYPPRPKRKKTSSAFLINMSGCRWKRSDFNTKKIAPGQSYTPKEWKANSPRQKPEPGERFAAVGWREPKHVPRGDQYKLVMTNDFEGQMRQSLIWISFFHRMVCAWPGRRKNQSPAGASNRLHEILQSHRYR